MNLLVLSVLGAVLVRSSAAEDPARYVPETDIYTGHVHYRYTPKTTTPQPLVNDEDLITEMLLAEDGDQRRGVVGPPDPRDLDKMSRKGLKGSRRTGGRRNLKASTGAQDGSGDGDSVSRMVELVKGQVLGHQRPTIDKNLELLPELGSGIYSELGADPDPLSVPLEVLQKKYPDQQVDGVRPGLSFKDYAALLSIEDHQKRQKAEDLLPTPHEQRVPSSDPSNPHDSLHIRQAGYLCGVFENPLFHGELRAINESAFLLRNVFISPLIRYDKLKVVFRGPNVRIPMDFTIKDSDKLYIHSKLFLLDTKQVLGNLDRVTLKDNMKHFSVSLNISRCRRPTSVWGPEFSDTKNGLTTGPVVLHTANVMVIKSFTYPGNCPAAYFWAGTGRNPEDGFKVPTIDGSLDPVRAMKNEDVLLMLPGSTTFYDLDYVGVYCPALSQMLGRHVISPTLWDEAVLPPAFTSEDRIRHPRIAF